MQPSHQPSEQRQAHGSCSADPETGLEDIAESVLVVADDFTGANDVGALFAERGAFAEVLFQSKGQPVSAGDAIKVKSAPVIDSAAEIPGSSDHQQPLVSVQIINTDSRAMPAAMAADHVVTALETWQSGSVNSAMQKPHPAGLRYRWFFKKVDSTLRGNLGAEVEAMLTTLKLGLAIVAPALPYGGRTIVQGNCLVRGMPLTQTEFASDPKTPVISASLAEILATQTRLPMRNLDLIQLRSTGFTDWLQQLAYEQSAVDHPLILIADTEQQTDLELLMSAVRTLAVHPLLVGSAGLAHAFCQASEQTQSASSYVKTAQNQCHRRTGADWTRPLLSRQQKAPFLGIVGSMSEIAQQQIAAVCDRYPMTLIDLDVTPLLAQGSLAHDPCDWLASALQALQAPLIAGQSCLVRTCSDSQERFRIAELCARHGTDRVAFGERVCQQLGQLVATIVHSSLPLKALYLSGGDVAIAVARQLGAHSFRICGQAAGCVPYGYLNGSILSDTPVLTKAGGFGTSSTLVELLHFLEEYACE